MKIAFSQRHQGGYDIWVRVLGREVLQELAVAGVFLVGQRALFFRCVGLGAFFQNDLEAVHARNAAQALIYGAVEGDGNRIGQLLPCAVVVFVGRA